MTCYRPLSYSCVCDTVFSLCRKNPSPAGTGISCRVCSYHVLLTAALPWEYCRAGPWDQFVSLFVWRGVIPYTKTYCSTTGKIGGCSGKWVRFVFDLASLLPWQVARDRVFTRPRAGRDSALLVPATTVRDSEFVSGVESVSHTGDVLLAAVVLCVN